MKLSGSLTTSPVWAVELLDRDWKRSGSVTLTRWCEKYRTIHPATIKEGVLCYDLPMHSLDSVRADANSVSLTHTAMISIPAGCLWRRRRSDPSRCSINYSDKQDAAISNWDVANMIFADTLTHVPRSSTSKVMLTATAWWTFRCGVPDSYIFAGGPAPESDLPRRCRLLRRSDISDAVYLRLHLSGRSGVLTRRSRRLAA